MLQPGARVEDEYFFVRGEPAQRFHLVKSLLHTDQSGPTASWIDDHIR